MGHDEACGAASSLDVEDGFLNEQSAIGERLHDDEDCRTAEAGGFDDVGNGGFDFLVAHLTQKNHQADLFDPRSSGLVMERIAEDLFGHFVVKSCLDPELIAWHGRELLLGEHQITPCGCKVFVIES